MVVMAGRSPEAVLPRRGSGMPGSSRKPWVKAVLSSYFWLLKAHQRPKPPIILVKCGHLEEPTI
jgi:hypothetical protein